jgi:hypothetical protein
MRATFEFVEPFDRLPDLLGKRFPCELVCRSEREGLVIFDDQIVVSGSALAEISVRLRYEASSLNDLRSGECVNVNGSGKGVHVIGLVRAVGDPA